MLLSAANWLSVTEVEIKILDYETPFCSNLNCNYFRDIGFDVIKCNPDDNFNENKSH